MVIVTFSFERGQSKLRKRPFPPAPELASWITGTSILSSQIAIVRKAVLAWATAAISPLSASELLKTLHPEVHHDFAKKSILDLDRLLFPRSGWLSGIDVCPTLEWF